MFNHFSCILRGASSFEPSHTVQVPSTPRKRVMRWSSFSEGTGKDHPGCTVSILIIFITYLIIYIMVSFSLEAPLYLSWDDCMVHFLRTWGSWNISQASEVNTRTRSTRLSIVRREDVWGRFWVSPSHKVFGRPWYSSIADSENHRSALNLSDHRHFSGEQWGPTFNMPFARGWQMDVTLLPRII